LLLSLAAQERTDDFDVEVFVADNDPDSCEALKVCNELASSFRWPIGCGIVREPGISAARNAILEHARVRGVDFIAMVDDDEVVAPDWLVEIVSAQRRFGADVVGGPMYYRFDEHTPVSVERCGVFVTPERPEGILPIIQATPNVLVDCRRLNECGWPQFDPRFGLSGGEDREFFVRLRNCGFRFAWAPNAKTFEPVPKSRTRATWILRRSFSNGNSDMRIRRCHGDTGGALLSFAKAAAVLASAPLGAVLLLVPSRRLWILGKWFRSLGKIAALTGYRWDEYAPARITGVEI
jgi:glycosyltransferase involved in cell wall biosynthesis